MTIRTGKGGRYRYYSCSTAAWQGETGCKGRAIPMEKLDDLVAGHLKERLLDPERLSEILATVLDRRQDRTERRREHIGELNRRAAEADARLRRLYGAIESGIADLDDPALKERVAELKATRDQAQADAQRAAQTAERISAAITPDHVAAFQKKCASASAFPAGAIAATCFAPSPSGSKSPSGKSVRIMGTKGNLFRTLVAASGVKSATGGVPTSVLNWRNKTGAGPSLFGTVTGVRQIRLGRFRNRDVAQFVVEDGEVSVSQFQRRRRLARRHHRKPRFRAHPESLTTRIRETPMARKTTASVSVDRRKRPMASSLDSITPTPRAS